MNPREANILSSDICDIIGGKGERACKTAWDIFNGLVPEVIPKETVTKFVMKESISNDPVALKEANLVLERENHRLTKVISGLLVKLQGDAEDYSNKVPTILGACRYFFNSITNNRFKIQIKDINDITKFRAAVMKKLTKREKHKTSSHYNIIVDFIISSGFDVSEKITIMTNDAIRDNCLTYMEAIKDGSLDGERKSAIRLRTRKQVFTQFFNDLVEEGLVAKSPITFRSSRYSTKKGKNLGALTALKYSAFQPLIDQQTNPYDKALVALYLFTGVRKMAAAYLMPSALDFENNIVHLTAEHVDIDVNSNFKTVYRQIPMNTEILKPLLLDLMKTRKENHYLFPHVRTGRVWSETGLNDHRVGILPKDINCRMMRRSTASWLFNEKKLTSLHIAKILGNSKAMAEENYILVDLGVIDM
jgi:integrase